MKRHQDLTRKSGDTIRITVPVTDDQDSPKSLVGCSARYLVASTLAGPALITKTVGNGITIADAAGGVLVIVLAPADTDELAGVYVHELEITDSAGDKATVFDGRLTLIQDL